MAEDKVEKKSIVPEKKRASKSLSIPLYTHDGATTESVNVPHLIFGVNASDKLLAQYIYVYLQNQRAGTANTKTRGEVTGSTRKIYRQKGTGRARHGARYAPIFVGGGVAHGPKAYKRVRSLSKKQRNKALLYALSLRLNDGDMMAIASTTTLEPKTKVIIGLMSQLKLAASPSVLFVYSPESEKMFAKATRNIVNAQSVSSTNINAYDVLRCSKLVFSKEGLESFLAHYSTHEKK